MNTFSISDIQSSRKIEEGDYGVFMKHASVYEGLSGASRLNPNRKALTYISSPDPVDDSQSWSYLELLDEVRRTANLFSSLIAGQTPRVAMLLPAIPQAYFTLFGGETAGVVCPINYMLDEEHIADLVRATRANLLVALGPNVELDIWSRVAGLKQKCPNLRHLLAVGGAPHALDFDAELKKMPASSLQFSRLVDSNSVAALFHTGGTTGKPKLAQHTHGNQLHAAWGAAQMYGAAPEDVVINGFPLFHVAGSFVYGLSTLLSGGEVILPTLIGMRNKTFTQFTFTSVSATGWRIFQWEESW